MNTTILRPTSAATSTPKPFSVRLHEHHKGFVTMLENKGNHVIAEKHKLALKQFNQKGHWQYREFCARHEIYSFTS